MGKKSKLTILDEKMEQDIAELRAGMIRTNVSTEALIKAKEDLRRDIKELIFKVGGK